MTHRGRHEAEAPAWGASAARQLRAAVRSPGMLALPALAFVGFLALWPMGHFLIEAARDGDAWSLLQFRRLFASATFLVVLLRTLGVAIAVTAICLALALPLAYALVRAQGKAKLVIIGLVVLPYLTSVIVRTYAWAAILALEGPVNAALVGLGLIEKPILLGHSDVGTMLGMVHILLPIAALTLWSAMEKIDRAHVTVAASLGAPKPEAFFTAYLPQALPGLAAAATLVYILALGAYVIPQTLGATRGILFAQMLVEQATTLLNWNLAAAMGVIMLVAAAAPPLVFRAIGWLAGRRRGRALGGLQDAVSRLLMPALNGFPDRLWSLAWKVVAAVVLAFLVLPEVIILVFSVGPERQITFPPQYLTLDGYRHTLSDPSWMRPLGRSVGYALADAVIATGLGALAAYGFARSGRAWARAGITVLALPIILPEIIIAISFFIFANRLGMAGTAHGIILGQAAVTVGLVVVILMGVMRQLDENLEYAAMMCGASRARAVRDVVLPLAAPGLLVGFVYGFLHAFDNLVLPLFIAGTRDTVTVRMFVSLQEELTSAPAVIATILILALVTVLAIALARSGRSGRGLPFPGAGLGKGSHE